MFLSERKRMHAPAVIRSEEEASRAALTARAVSDLQIDALDRTLLWRAIDTMPGGRTAPELSLWAELARQIDPDRYFREPEPLPPARGHPDDRLQIQEWFALFEPKLGLTIRVSETLGNWIADYDHAERKRVEWTTVDPEGLVPVLRLDYVPCVHPHTKRVLKSSWAGPPEKRENSYHCVLQKDFVMTAFHLFLGIHQRDDAIALDLSVLDELQGSFDRLPERRTQLMHDYGMDKIRLINPMAVWSPFDNRNDWSWGSVERIFMLLRPSIKYETAKSRIEGAAALDPHGHWVLCVYERRTNVVHTYDSREHLEERERTGVLEVIRNMLTGFGLFNQGLSIPLTDPTDGAARMVEPNDRVRAAYSQEADWECGHFVIRQTEIILRRGGSHGGGMLWDEWASQNTKANPGSMDNLRRLMDNYTRFVAPQREYSRRLMAQTMANLRLFVEARAQAGLWNIIRPT